MSTPFPESVVPAERSFQPGNYAMQSFRAMSGAETRILYGDKLLGTELTLKYRTITDKQAGEFIDHYGSMKGTYEPFKFSVQDTKVKDGWKGEDRFLSPHMGTDPGIWWRYKAAPSVTNVYPGYSDVEITLVGVNRV